MESKKLGQTITKLYTNKAFAYITEIKSNLICPYCGGKYHNGKCMYCLKPNDKLSKAIENLEQIIMQYSKLMQQYKLPVTTFNSFLNALYSLGQIDIDIVNEFLNKYDYFTKVDLFYEHIKERIKEGGIIYEDEIPVIEAIIKRNDGLYQKDVNNNVIGDYFISHIFYNHLDSSNVVPMLSYDAFRSLIIGVVENITKKNYGYHEARCLIIPSKEFGKYEDDEVVVGDNEGNITRLNEDLVKAMYERGNSELINTIYHELRHAYHYKQIFSGKEISYMGMLATMDKILKELIPGYYQENYERISYEKDAQICGIIAEINVLASYGLTPLKKDEMIKKINDLHLNIGSLKRYVNGEEFVIEELFNICIKDKPIYLKRYPQLQYLYKEEEGIIVPKASEELKTDYENLCENGEISVSLKEMYEYYISRQR